VNFDIISKALKSFTNDPKINRGRANIFEWGSKVAVLDYAHNEAAMEALLSMMKAYDKGGKTHLLIGTTGDRRNLISGINDVIIKHNPDSIVLKETESYLRGAEPMELPLAISKDLVAKGYDSNAISVEHCEMIAVKKILDKMEDNDVAILCCQAEVENVVNFLDEYSSNN
jgi:UDP-N-acetylmuramyl tripeptide synthase